MVDSEPLFFNQLPERLELELQTAESLEVQPVRPNDRQFTETVNLGTIKWAVKANDDLVIMPHTIDGIELAHTVLTQGKPVRSAGEADIVAFEETFIGLSINNHSGHYMPDAASLDTGVKKFAEAGINFADEDIQRV